MGNSFGTDILIQAKDPKAAAEFYVRQLGFTVTDDDPEMMALHGEHLNLFIERGPALGPVLEVTVPNVPATRAKLVEAGCEVVKDEPEVPRVYLRDPYGLVYNLTE
jgi:predicted enzyme related to lactoylglutathione lyase